MPGYNILWNLIISIPILIILFIRKIFILNSKNNLYVPEKAGVFYYVYHIL